MQVRLPGPDVQGPITTSRIGVVPELEKCSHGVSRVGGSHKIGGD